jgi:hypothetical protein
LLGLGIALGDALLKPSFNLVSYEAHAASADLDGFDKEILGNHVVEGAGANVEHFAYRCLAVNAAVFMSGFGCSRAKNHAANVWVHLRSFAKN